MKKRTGNDPLSRAVPRQVSWALGSLTSVFGMGTGVASPPSPPDPLLPHAPSKPNDGTPQESNRHGNHWSSVRPISASQLRASPRFHPWPIDVVVHHGSLLSRAGGLFSRGASHLDAFSAYPVRAWLPSRALGRTTGAPAARPSRSSRTGDSPTQASDAHSG